MNDSLIGQHTLSTLPTTITFRACDLEESDHSNATGVQRAVDGKAYVIFKAPGGIVYVLKPDGGLLVIGDGN